MAASLSGLATASSLSSEASSMPRGGPGYAAFPSGHMVAIGAIVSVFWFLHPRSRAIWAICMAMVFIGQLGANYHFVSDLVAGGVLGYSVGWLITVCGMQLLDRLGFDSAADTTVSALRQRLRDGHSEQRADKVRHCDERP
jgi:PAP2 superfamily